MTPKSLLAPVEADLEALALLCVRILSPERSALGPLALDTKEEEKLKGWLKDFEVEAAGFQVEDKTALPKPIAKVYGEEFTKWDAAIQNLKTVLSARKPEDQRKHALRDFLDICVEVVKFEELEQELWGKELADNGREAAQSWVERSLYGTGSSMDGDDRETLSFMLQQLGPESEASQRVLEAAGFPHKTWNGGSQGRKSPYKDFADKWTKWKKKTESRESGKTGTESSSNCSTQ